MLIYAGYWQGVVDAAAELMVIIYWGLQMVGHNFGEFLILWKSFDGKRYPLLILQYLPVRQPVNVQTHP
jgi:hypothetical protein